MILGGLVHLLMPKYISSGRLHILCRKWSFL